MKLAGSGVGAGWLSEWPAAHLAVYWHEGYQDY